jgi:hypothetical protein
VYVRRKRWVHCPRPACADGLPINGSDANRRIKTQSRR